MDPTIVVVDEAAQLAAALNGARDADRLAIDVEGNGLFAYRARVCTVQLGWHDGSAMRVVIVDAMAVDPAPLAPLLGASGPVKILHDLAFDARMLQEAGIALGRVEDTSVMARMLGRQATGLATLLGTELGITVSKTLQQHDWSQRPLAPEHIGYLAADVLHLGPLADRLMAEVRAVGVEDEVREECAFKLATALAPPRERSGPRPRIKGAEALNAEQRSLLGALVEARERVALRRDQPPFKVASPDRLIELALRGLRAPEQRSVPSSAAGTTQRELLLEVLEEAGRVPCPPIAAPEPPPRLDPALIAARRARQRRLSNWRRAEAAARGVDEQAVLPGHCLQDLSELDDSSWEALAGVAGLGQCRLARYGATLLALLGGPTT